MPRIVSEKDKAETRTVSLPKSTWEALDVFASGKQKNRSEIVKYLIGNEISFDSDKAVKKSVSFPPALLSEAEKAADRDHAGNLSRYLQDLVERDLSNGTTKPDALSQTVIVDLARVLGGEMLARDLASALKDADQPAELYRLLRSISPAYQAEFTGIVGRTLRDIKAGGETVTAKIPLVSVTSLTSEEESVANKLIEQVEKPKSAKK